jgi:methionyl-tRNA formyltransferase
LSPAASGERPKVVFMGTPSFAVPSLRAVARRCEVVAVVTRPDRPRGRGRQVESSEVAAAATEMKLEVIKTETMKSDTLRAEVQGRAPDLFAVVAFGAILPSEWLRVPRLGAINLHGSLLPEYRGASPVQRALMDGRSATGVTTIWMDEGIDTGDRILQRWEPIAADDTAATLGDRLANLGAPLLAESLVRAANGLAPRIPQPAHDGSYAPRLRKKDGWVDWSQSAESVWSRQRAVTPWPGATTSFAGRGVLITKSWPHDTMSRDAEPGTVLEVSADGVRVACGRGSLQLVAVKPEGKGELQATEWARGARIAPGVRFEAVTKGPQEEAV